MKKSLFALILVTPLVSLNTNALEPNGYRTDSGVLITPFLETGAVTDDNIYNQPTNEFDTSIFTIAPSVNFLLEDGVKKIELDLGLESVYVDEYSEDNHLDSYLNFNYHVERGTQSRWDISADVRKITEARGTGITQGDPERFSVPLTFDDQSAAITYEYGALSTSMRFAVDLDYYNKSYNNFRESTSHLDNDNLLIGTTLYYTTNSKTNMFLEVSQNDINYGQLHPSGITRDSDDTLILLGVQLEATALMTGSFKLGHQKKSFIDPNRETFSGLSWDLDIEWKPLTYSSFVLSSSSRAVDPYIEGDYINVTGIGFSWQHQWTNSFNTRFEYSFSESEYSGQNSVRTDDNQMLSLSFDYALLRWLDVSLFTQIIDRDSTRSDIVYEKTLLGVNFRMSI